MTLLMAVPALGQADSTGAAAIGALLVDNLLERDYMYYGDEALHYAEAAAAVGALRLATARNAVGTVEQLRQRYESLLDDTSNLVSRRPHVDMNVIGIVPLQIAIATGGERFRAQGLTFADRQWTTPTPGGLTDQSRWWIDDLYMVGMLQIQAYRATGNEIYADRAAHQVAAYLPVLQRKNGLFYHSPDVPIFWGRGNGWVASAMAEVLSSLPADHALRPELLERYTQMMETLLELQGPDGLWRQVLDHDDAWSETSGSAMFAYAMAAGINRGFLAGNRYAAAIDRAWRGLIEKLDDDGNLADVCIGTSKKNDLQYYLDRPRISGDLHGQAPMLWLAAEIDTLGSVP
jgi:unsaturated rhamnogalacturonyl hydrolase